jgi:hypothetical protein
MHALETLARISLARYGEVHVIVLVMANPGLALHEIQVRLQVGAARCGKQAGKKGRVKDDERNAGAARLGGHVQLVQVLGDRREVDAVLPILCIGIEFNVLAEAAGEAGG